MSTNSEQALDGEPQRHDVLTQVSDTMIGLYTDVFGVAPARARSHWAGPDALVCILDDTLDPMERNLVNLGEHDRLRDSRQFFQYSMIDDFCRPVEQLTGRTLEAFHSSTDPEVDGQSVEMFVFHPAGYDGPSRIQRAKP